MFRKTKEGALAEHSIVGILGFLMRRGEMRLPTKKERDMEYYINTMNLIKRYGKESLVRIKEGGVFLTEKGRKLAENIFSASKNSEITYGSELKTRASPKKVIQELQKTYKKFSPRKELDQAPLLPASATAKIAYAIKRGDVDGKRIVCIGDDDFLSIILAITGKPKEILVLDVDPKVLKIIRDFSKKSKIKIKVLKRDLRKPIPQKLKGKYDTAFFWSSDTEIGFSLFASRSIELLNKRGVIYANITPIWCHPIELFGIRRRISDVNLKITDFVQNSGSYIFNRKRWNVDLIRMQKTSRSKPLYTIFRGKIPF